MRFIYQWRRYYYMSVYSLPFIQVPTTLLKIVMFLKDLCKLKLMRLVSNSIQSLFFCSRIVKKREDNKNKK